MTTQRNSFLALTSLALAIGLTSPLYAQDEDLEQSTHGFEDPVQLQAVSGPAGVHTTIEGADFGSHYAGPHFADIDHDGINDLIVGDITGRIYFHKGNGSIEGAPFEDPIGLLMSNGELLVFKNWGGTSLRPQLVDFNNDGIDDLIAGGFGGQSYVAYGSEEGFGAPTTIQGNDGIDVVVATYYDYETARYLPSDPLPFEGTISEETAKDRTLAFTLVDWDADGDQDILLGSKSGRFYLRENVGEGNEEPEFSNLNTVLAFNEGGALGTGGERSNPVVADWDGDGLFDIISGSYSGAVYLLLNSGQDGEPAFESAQELISPPDAISVAGRSGARSTVEVVDYDGDGQLDLLVGDLGGFVWFYQRQ